MKGLLMAELIADLFISLDGFAAGENAGPGPRGRADTRLAPGHG
jgi:hypothetical protein